MTIKTLQTIIATNDSFYESDKYIRNRKMCARQQHSNSLMVKL